MTQHVASPEESDPLCRISFADLKQFTCSASETILPTKRSYSTSRKNKIAVRFPTQIFQQKDVLFQQKDVLYKQVQVSTKNVNQNNHKSIKFPRLENRKQQKQKRDLSAMCRHRKSPQQPLPKDSPRHNLLSRINFSKNTYPTQPQKKLQSKFKPSSHMKILLHKKPKQLIK